MTTFPGGSSSSSPFGASHDLRHWSAERERRSAAIWSRRPEKNRRFFEDLFVFPSEQSTVWGTQGNIIYILLVFKQIQDSVDLWEWKLQKTIHKSIEDILLVQQSASRPELLVAWIAFHSIAGRRDHFIRLGTEPEFIWIRVMDGIFTGTPYGKLPILLGFLMGFLYGRLLGCL